MRQDLRRIGLCGVMGLVLSAAGGCDGAAAASVTYACRMESAKIAAGAETLCTRFGARLQAAHPGRSFAMVEHGNTARVVLQVQRAGAQMIEASVWVDGSPGAALGAARRDGPLDGAAIDRLLDQLIAQAPAI